MGGLAVNQLATLRQIVVPKSSLAPTQPCDLVVDDLWSMVADDPGTMILTPRQTVREAIAWISVLSQKAGIDDARMFASYVQDLDDNSPEVTTDRAQS